MYVRESTVQGVRLILGQIEGIIGALIRFGKRQVLPKFQPAIWMTGYFRNNRSSKSYITSTGIHWIFPKMTYPIIITGQFTCVLKHLMHNNIKCTWLTHYNKFVVTGAKSHWLLKCVEVSGPLLYHCNYFPSLFIIHAYVYSPRSVFNYI